MAPAARCGILLHPAGHTLSPVLHARAYAALGLDAVYEVFDVPPEQLERTLARLRAEGIRQLSVSLPHKERALQLADQVSPAAARIGAANTLTTAGASLQADNTDWLGVTRALERHRSFAGCRATVLGAGGAARAVVYALRELGAEVALVNRTSERARRLARDLDARVGTLEEPWDLLVNATSVGMTPRSDATPFPAALLRSVSESRGAGLVFDLVYAPLETRLLREASAAGHHVQDGLDMLVHQAVEQVRLWSGLAPDPAELRRAAEEALAHRP